MGSFLTAAASEPKRQQQSVGHTPRTPGFGQTPVQRRWAPALAALRVNWPGPSQNEGPAQARTVRAVSPTGEARPVAIRARCGVAAPPGLARALAAERATAWRLSDLSPSVLSPSDSARSGAQLDQVRVHDGPEAAALARALGARAFTLGRDIVMGARFRGAEDGAARALLGHELGHARSPRAGLVLRAPLVRDHTAYAITAPPTRITLKGEILLTSMDRDGTRDGFDVELTRAVADRVPIPVIASGGVGNLEHLYQGVVAGGADAVLAASIFHFGEYTVGQARDYLRERGVPVRQ